MKSEKMEGWKAHKFGGSSLATAERFKCVAGLINEKKNVVIVSAIYGITDALIKLMSLAAQKKTYKDELNDIRGRHYAIINDLLEINQRTKLAVGIQADIYDIENMLRSVSLLGSYSEEIYALIAGYGEQWSANILTAYLSSSTSHNVVYINARDILFIEKEKRNIQVLWRKSENSFKSFTQENPADIYVITGFIASLKDGKLTTLGRNGSDFSASIFARLGNMDSLTIWTDVDGIMSADPKKVPSAFVLDGLTYEEVLELAYFGANIIHPKAIAPAIEKEIPIYIRNSCNPDIPGTKIFKDAKSVHKIKGLSHIDDIALITIEGSGMIGVPGFAAKVFGILNEINVSVTLITQASSEHSICFAIPSSETKNTVDHLRDRLKPELREKIIKQIESEINCSILAVVGENMVGSCGVAATICKSLAKASINIKAIAQGSSERNMSFVIDSGNVTKALKTVHSAFYLSNKTLSVGVIGPGSVGKTLLTQLKREKKRLEDKLHLSIRIRGIMNSKHMLLDEQDIDLNSWEDSLAKMGKKNIMNVFVNHIASAEYPHNVIIDCTSSEKICGKYIEFIKNGLHIITPNKKANSASYSSYKSLMNAVENSQGKYFYEATVCAGLPVISTLQDFLATGDEIREIEGIFSGTLAYIFYHFKEGTKFSEIVTMAKEKGYTEPDPRDDLSGLDIARKVVILAREIGIEIEFEDVVVDSLVPEELVSVSVNEFMKKLHLYDDKMTTLLQKAMSNNEKLHYIGKIHPDGKVTVELKSYPANHAFSNLKETDNIVSFTTRRYDKQPLIIKGPGAGAEVTAAGIFADVLRLARSLE